MKMISSTSITSTSGTTLISASDVATRAPRAAPSASAAACLLTFGMVASIGELHGPSASIYVKFRSEMFRNSSEKSSISDAKCFTLLVKWL